MGERMTQTAIPTTGIVKCPHCGFANTVDVGNETGLFRCACGKTLRHRQCSPSVTELLSLFGYRLSVDYDGALLVDSASDMPVDLFDWFFNHQADLRSGIERDGRVARACYIGGSKAGEKHHHYSMYRMGPVYIHVARAHWETYEFRSKGDSRLYFVGRSTSKRKAKQGAFVQTGKRGE